MLRAAGRHTVALYTQGVFFTEGERLDRYRETDFGFARATHVDRDADEQAAAAIGELDDLVRRGEPSGLLWVHFFDAHAPYQGSGPTAAAQYDDAVARIDAAMGRVLAHARRVLARDLVVAVTADHGEEFGDHGGVYHGSTLYDEQVRVPLVISAPGLTARRVSAPVELIDVAPTLVALNSIIAPAAAASPGVLQLGSFPGVLQLSHCLLPGSMQGVEGAALRFGDPEFMPSGGHRCALGPSSPAAAAADPAQLARYAGWLGLRGRAAALAGAHSRRRSFSAGSFFEKR